MKTSIAFLGILSTVFVASYLTEEPSMDQTGSITQASNSPDEIVWQLTISGIEKKCTGSFIAEKEYLVSSGAMSNCISVFPDLENLASIGFDTDGDITLFHKNGSKLVEFMETESTHLESFWPAHPLMTLAKANTMQ